MKNLPNSPESRDIASVLHAYTNLKAHQETGPLVIRKGKGIWVYDESGKGYIEGLAGLWCTSLGFGEERLVEAAARRSRNSRRRDAIPRTVCPALPALRATAAAIPRSHG